jgi:peroxiredoxin
MLKKVIVAVLCLGLFVFLSCSKQNGNQGAGVANKGAVGLHLTGNYLDGSLFDSSALEGKKLLFGFFSTKHRDALRMIQGLQKIQSFERTYNFKIILVSIDYNNKGDVQKFITDNKIDFPVVLEGPSLAMAMQLGVENEVSLSSLGSDHMIEFEIKKFVYPASQEGALAFLSELKEGLKIREQQTTEPRLGIYPEAPDFTVKTLKGQTLSLAGLKGKVVLLVFFSPRCPHCHDELEYLNKDLYPQLKNKGLEVVALSTMSLDGDTLAAYNEGKYSWPVADDHLRKVHKLYSTRTAVPETYFIDREGKIRFTNYGFGVQHEDLFTFRIKQLLVVPNPPVLSNKKFSGTGVCAACHEPEYVSWSVTPHAQAWETLEVQGSDMNPQCVTCHSLGANDPKGYLINKDTPKVFVPPTLTDVQCENCHGIGGPHVAEAQDVTKDPAALNKKCLACHTPEFSLYFNYDQRIKKTNHSDAAKIMKMTPEERLALLKKVAKKPEDLFDVSKEYVGVEKCAECHDEIAKKFKKGVHVNTAAGCESCHGPGSVHVKTSKKADVQALGDECDFCVKGQICGSCHDETTSPNFNLKKGLEEVRKDHQ